MQSRSNCWPRSTSVFHALACTVLVQNFAWSSWQSVHDSVPEYAASPLGGGATAMLAAALVLISPVRRKNVLTASCTARLQSSALLIRTWVTVKKLPCAG